MHNAALLAVLDAQRSHVLDAVRGLSDDDLRRPVLPSGWSCLGMVRHLALDVERFWFRAVVAGEKVPLMSGAQAWQVDPTTSGAEVLELYRDEAARSDAIVGMRAPDARPAWWPVEIFPRWPEQDLGATILHVITETACHAGHLDAARELIDGHQHLVLTV